MSIEKIFREYNDFVVGVINSYIHDEDEARDLANVVFLKIYQNLSRFDSTNLGGWIRTIAVHVAIDYLRRKPKNQLLTPETNNEGLSLDVFGDGTEDDLVNHLTYLQVVDSFKKLPPKKRKILELFYVQNMTAEDISKLLNIPKGTVKATLSRTRKELKWQQLYYSS